MRISELSRRSNVPMPAIKYYVREGLLPPGERTEPNQVRYEEDHVHRLRLIRALLEVGELSIIRAKEVLAAVDDPELSVHQMLGTAQKSVSGLSVAEVMSTARALGHEDVADLSEFYAAAAADLAVAELDWVAQAGTGSDMLAERAVIGTVLGDALLLALRREAQRQESVARFGGNSSLVPDRSRQIPAVPPGH